MVERFNGRIATEALPICVANHADLETLHRGFCLAYNHRKQRMVAGLSRTEHATAWRRRRLKSRNPGYIKSQRNDIMKQVDEILDYANNVYNMRRFLLLERINAAA